MFFSILYSILFYIFLIGVTHYLINHLKNTLTVPKTISIKENIKNKEIEETIK